MMKWDNAVLLVLVVVLVGSIVYAFGSDRNFLTAPDMAAQEMGPQAVTTADLPTLPVIAKAPAIAGIVDWINTEPLTSEELRGKVVLIDFWTYSCINCIRTFPFVQGWHEKYSDKGLVLLGVHAPEFEFEKRKENIVQAMEEHGLTYPVAMDNDFVTWRAFSNQYWPAHYLIDAEGNLRYFHFGEGQYDETEAAIQSLLVEAGLTSVEDLSAAEGLEESDRLPRTPEIYLGYKRINQFGSGAADVQPDEPYDFPVPSLVRPDYFYLTGRWTIGLEASELVGDTGSIVLPFQGKELNMVLEHGEEEGVEVEVLVDGEPIAEALQGEDIVQKDGRTMVRVKDSRLYSIFQSEQSGRHDFELKARPGLRAFTFTFG